MGVAPEEGLCLGKEASPQNPRPSCRPLSWDGPIRSLAHPSPEGKAQIHARHLQKDSLSRPLQTFDIGASAGKGKALTSSYWLATAFPTTARLAGKQFSADYSEVEKKTLAPVVSINLTPRTLLSRFQVAGSAVKL
jgi:hypothetical protein